MLDVVVLGYTCAAKTDPLQLTQMSPSNLSNPGAAVLTFVPEPLSAWSV